jgi:hypothetical protein
MATDRPAPKRKYKPRSLEAKRRRKTLGYFKSICASLPEKVYEVDSTLDVRDADRIITDLLAANLNCYAGIDDSGAFTEWAVEWVQRIARLTVTVKEMIPGLAETAANVPGIDSSECKRCAHCVLNCLDQYTGNHDEVGSLNTWATSQAIREAFNSQVFREWYELHQKAVYAGLWDVLTGCTDLGLGQADEDGRNETVDSLARDCWCWVADHVNEFLEPGTATIATKLRALGAKFATFWKIERLRERAKQNLHRRVGRLAVKLAHDLGRVNTI